MRPIAFILAIALGANLASADPAAPRTDDAAESPLPQSLTLEQAVQFFHEHGLDLLIAEANVQSAEGDVAIANQLANPQLSVDLGRSFYTGNCGTNCSVPNQYSISISDQAVISDLIAGKRHLRDDVASTALAAAKLGRVDADRALVFQVKSQFEQVLVAQLALSFAKDTVVSNATLLEKTQNRASAGQIGDADVLRVKTLKLESDQAVDAAQQALVKARAQLAFLLGVRSAVPAFTVDEPRLAHYELPPKLASASHDQLLASAFAARPDLAAQQAQLDSARAQLALAKRTRFPEIALSLGYSQQGTTPSDPSPPTFSIGLSAPIPVLYQQQGEIEKGSAGVRTAELGLQKLRSTVVNDFETAYADFVGSQVLVQRMEQGELLATARQARDAVVKAKELGAASLLDEMNAISTYIATNVEYQNDLANYWTAVFELEHAVGSELLK